MSEHSAKPGMTNRLAREPSPYLLQHAANPVDWYPWGPEAIERARQEDKPILLSIGYSACHWCHVMAHESFENPAIARIMNEEFVNIKVDREERPDLDELYMNAVQMMTGHGGWPLTVFLTPALEPFYGGTYFPPDDRGGLPSFPRVLERLADFYRARKGEIQQHVGELVSQLKGVGTLAMEPSSRETALSATLLDNAVRHFSRTFDPAHGGFGNAPKFPHAMGLQLLLRHWRRSNDPAVLQMITTSLERMAHGGMYDQLGGGFHRYSVDERWLIPHFEKMLYDNALLAQVYAEGFQATRTPLFRQIAEEILEYVLREMTGPEGGFHSTQDADSEGEEGKFYVWTPEEIAAMVGEREGRILCRFFGVTPKGNFDHGRSVLHLAAAADVVAELEQTTPEEVERIATEGKITLFTARSRRTPPGRDEKILTNWNGLMLSAFARAARLFNHPHYRAAAVKNASFLRERLVSNGVLHHLYKDGVIRQRGFLDDHTFLANGLLDLYEATFDPAWLAWAVELMETASREFWDEDEGGYFYTGTRHEPLPARSKSPYDNAVPSGNSVGALVLLRLARLTGNVAYRKQGETLLLAFRPLLLRMPTACAQMLVALDYHLFPDPEIVVVGPRRDRRTGELLDILDEYFLPNAVVVLRDPADPPDPLIPWVADKTMAQGKAAAHVCRNFTCQVPATDPEQLRALL